MPYCDDHKAHEEHFERQDARLKEQEQITRELSGISVRQQALQESMDKRISELENDRSTNSSNVTAGIVSFIVAMGAYLLQGFIH